jgi:hypothetical protein
LLPKFKPTTVTDEPEVSTALSNPYEETGESNENDDKCVPATALTVNWTATSLMMPVGCCRQDKADAEIQLRVVHSLRLSCTDGVKLFMPKFSPNIVKEMPVESGTL